jgi:hypothetical protein
MHQVFLGVRSLLYLNGQADAGLSQALTMTAIGLVIGLLFGGIVTHLYDRKGFHRIQGAVALAIAAEHQAQHQARLKARKSAPESAPEPAPETPPEVDAETAPAPGPEAGPAGEPVSETSSEQT